MAINFPATPTLNQTYTFNGRTWTWNGVGWQATGSTGLTVYTKTDFTATAGQTSFSCTYTVGFVDVYYNGSKLSTSEYTATTGSTVVLGTACALNDIVETIAWTISSSFNPSLGSASATSLALGGATIGTNALAVTGTTIHTGAVAITGATTSTSLALGGATLGANALAVTGTTSVSGATTSASFIPSSATIPTNGVYLSAANTVAFATNSTNRAKFDANGCLVFDTATNNATTDNSIAFRSANSQLTINGSSASGGNLTLQGDGAGDASWVIRGATGATNAKSILGYAVGRAFSLIPTTGVVAGTGGVAVGDTTPTTLIGPGRITLCDSHSGYAGVFATVSSANTANFAAFGAPGASGFYTNDDSTASNQCWRFFNPNGNVGGITISGTTSTFNTTSDERLKNFEVPQRDFKEIIQTIMVKDGEFLAAPGDRMLMISAQQTAEIGYADAVEYPQDAHENDEQPQNIYWSADYARLAPLALWGVKDLYAENEALKATVADLVARLAALEAK